MPNKMFGATLLLSLTTKTRQNETKPAKESCKTLTCRTSYETLKITENPTKNRLFAIEKTSNNKVVLSQQARKDTVVIGILSHSGNVCLRNAHRRTTIPLAKHYPGLDVKIVFVLDSATPALLAEQKSNNDMVFLNVTELGWNHQFTLKLYLWFKYAVLNFPAMSMVGRMDDDAFICIPQAFDRLASFKHPRLYYGYGVVGKNGECLDDVYLFFGSELAKRITSRTHCSIERISGCLHDGTHPGTAINQWVKTSCRDYVLVNELRSGKIVYFFKNDAIAQKRKLQRLRTPHFCKRYFLYHKASATDIYRMHRNNRMLSSYNEIQNIPDDEIKHAEHCMKY